MPSRVLAATGRLALSPTQRANLRRIVNTFDAAIERERAHGGATSAEQMRARGVTLADVNIGLDRKIAFRAVHALAGRGLLRVETTRHWGRSLRRANSHRWLGGSVQREFVTARVTPTDEGRRQIAVSEGAIMADQLWLVFLDGIAQKDLLPFASSEEKALTMWRAQASLGPIAPARLRAVAKADSPGTARREPAPGRRAPARAAEEEILSADEHAALSAWANEHGRNWKAALRLAWETDDYRDAEHDAALQQLRNRLGPSWVTKHRLPVDPSDERTGYHCWVVTSKKPYQTRTWVATRRTEAVSQVKDAVREHKTEGGVHSRNPGKPFEVTFSVLRGKLITTKHTD